jgi:hypothetical protein
MIWDMMRSAAIWRHRLLHAIAEGGDPARWPAHMDVVRAFYGY